MSKLDQRIEEMLEAEDRALMQQLGEQGVFGQVSGLFQGKMGWISVITILVGFVAAIIGFYAGWQFILAEQTISMIRWGALAWASFFSLGLIKMWSWMRMETNRTLREIKRLELQVVRVLEKVSA